MQEYRLKRTAKPDLVFRGSLLFSIKIERVTYELYLTDADRYILSCAYYIFNIRYYRTALSFDTVEDLHVFSIIDNHFGVLNFMISKGVVVGQN